MMWARIGLGISSLALAGCATSGMAARPLVVEDFDGGVMEIQLSHTTDHWGDVLIADSADIAVVDDLGPDGSKAAVVEFRAELTSGDVTSWRDAYVGHNVWLDTRLAPNGHGGVALDVLPYGFSFAKAIVGQKRADGSYHARYARVALEEGQWQRLHLPFDSLRPLNGDGELRDDLPISIQLHVPVDENFARLHFREGDRHEAGVVLDNVSLYTAPRRPRDVVADFEQEAAGPVALVELINGGAYWQTASGDGATMHLTPGVTARTIVAERVAGGPEGRFLTVWGGMEIDEAVREFLAGEHKFVVQLELHVPVSWRAHDELSLMIRSPSFRDVVLAYEDWDNEIGYYAGGVGVNGEWTRVVLPFTRFQSDAGTLADARVWSAHPVMRLMFEVPVEDIEEALAEGTYGFTFDVDSIVLE